MGGDTENGYNNLWVTATVTTPVTRYANGDGNGTGSINGRGNGNNNGNTIGNGNGNNSVTDSDNGNINLTLRTNALTGRVDRNWTQSGGNPEPGFFLGELAQVPHYPETRASPGGYLHRT